jgi:hypothetical protein
MADAGRADADPVIDYAGTVSDYARPSRLERRRPREPQLSRSAASAAATESQMVVLLITQPRPAVCKVWRQPG